MKDKKMPVPDSGFDSKKYRLQINNEFSDCVIPELLIENRQIVHAALSTRITARRAGYPDRWQGESAWVFPRCEWNLFLIYVDDQLEPKFRQAFFCAAENLIVLEEILRFYSIV